MAQEQTGPPTKAPWTKIFTAFKVALDIKKLLLAAAGIFFVWVGWLALGWTFYEMRKFPEWKDFENKEKKDKADREAQWEQFKAKRASWNLIHELAGSADDKKPVRIDAGDVAGDLDEFLILKAWEEAYQRGSEEVQIKENKLEISKPTNSTFTLKPPDEAAKEALAKWNGKRFPLRALTIPAVKEAAKPEETPKLIKIEGVLLEVTEGPFDTLKKHREGVLTPEQITAEARQSYAPPVADKLLVIFDTQLLNPKLKKYGLLRVSPWSENRGANPYLLVTKGIETRGDSVFGGARFFSWFFAEEAPVVLEPLYKFLAPIVYLFDSRAGGWDRLYLILIILWTLFVWGFFGGAICRIAAVQVARNERITLREALLFAKERCWSYLAAPVGPMALIGFLTLLLMIFGWIEWTPYVGDVFAGVFWPVVILFGFIMTIVLVGLVGWPLMTATISTEGTDSFDALSRSYSYIYQAPWQFLWYNFLAVVYGAVLVFFVGFMASAMVFLGKWGVSNAVGLANADPKYDREPSYLFYYAPTSFGWRDLLISSNARFVEEQTKTDYDGRQVKRLEFKPEYEKELSAANLTGAVLVRIWLYLFFLLVIGFGYSYFWSVSTIVYFLMRRHVDDTEMDEVHLEDEELDDPFLKPPPTPPAPAAAPVPDKPGTVSLNVVEAPPPLPTPATSYATADHMPAPALSREAVSPPPENPHSEPEA